MFFIIFSLIIELITVYIFIRYLNKLTESQKQQILKIENDYKKNIQSLKSENQKIMSLLTRNESQTIVKENINKISQIYSIISNQKQRIDKLENEIKSNIQFLKSENQKMIKNLQQNESKISTQQLKCATKFSISGNQINLQNEKRSVLSSIPIPSMIDKYNFGSNNGYMIFTNHLIIQWGRYAPPPNDWCNKKDREFITIKFPVVFSTKPFLATTGGSGNDYHPCAEKVTNESFNTGYDHNQPTSWIAIGNI